MASLGDIIADATARYGLPSSYLPRVAQIESSGNPTAHNAIAAGLFGFTRSTGVQYDLTDPFNPAASADAAARYALDNITALTRRLGRAPTPEELYLGHQQGAGGAAKLLLNPTAPAASLVGAGAVAGNGGTPGMTAQQFVDMWANKFDGIHPGSWADPSATPGGSADGLHPLASAPVPPAGQPDPTPPPDQMALAAALAPTAPSPPDQSELSAMYADPASSEQQNRAARRAKLLSLARIAPTQQIT